MSKTIYSDQDHCPNCRNQALAPGSSCPSCGHYRQSRDQIRLLGILLATVGLVLTAGPATLIALIAMSMNGPKEAGGFEGGAAIATLAFGLLGALIAFGLAALVAGVAQAFYGKRNRRLTRIGLITSYLVFGVMALAQLVIRFFFR